MLIKLAPTKSPNTPPTETEKADTMALNNVHKNKINLKNLT